MIALLEFASLWQDTRSLFVKFISILFGNLMTTSSGKTWKISSGIPAFSARILFQFVNGFV